MAKTRMSQVREDYETLTLAWEQYFPTIPLPTVDTYMRSWLLHNPLGTVLAAFDYLSEGSYEGTEYLSKMITLTLKSVTYAT